MLHFSNKHNIIFQLIHVTGSFILPYSSSVSEKICNYTLLCIIKCVSTCSMWLSCVKERFPVEMQEHAKTREHRFTHITVFYLSRCNFTRGQRCAKSIVVAYTDDYRVACATRAVNYLVLSGHPVGAHFPVRFFLGTGKYFIFSFNDQKCTLWN